MPLYQTHFVELFLFSFVDLCFECLNICWASKLKSHVDDYGDDDAGNLAGLEDKLNQLKLKIQGERVRSVKVRDFFFLLLLLSIHDVKLFISIKPFTYIHLEHPPGK